MKSSAQKLQFSESQLIFNSKSKFQMKIRNLRCSKFKIKVGFRRLLMKIRLLLGFSFSGSLQTGLSSGLGGFLLRTPSEFTLIGSVLGCFSSDLFISLSDKKNWSKSNTSSGISIMMNPIREFQVRKGGKNLKKQKSPLK